MKKIYYFATIAVMLMTSCVSSAQKKEEEVDTYKLYTEYLKPIESSTLGATLKLNFINEVVDFKLTEHYIHKYNNFYNNPTWDENSLLYSIVMGDNQFQSVKDLLKQHDDTNEKLFDLKSTIRYYRYNHEITDEFANKLIKEIDAAIALNALNRAMCARYDI